MAVKAIITASIPFDVAKDLDDTATKFGVSKSWVVQKGLETFLGDPAQVKRQVKAKNATANGA